MVQIGQVVSWSTQGMGRTRLRKGIVRAVIEPGQKASEVCPELTWIPMARRNFKLVSQNRRVLVEEPRDGRGGRHCSKFYAPVLAAVVNSMEG